jgi:hypothetical protein
LKEKIQEALSKLDAANPNHWTDDGLPRVETVRMLAAEPKISREDITKDFPQFNRVFAATPPAAPSQAPAPEAGAADQQAPAATSAPAPTAAPAVERAAVLAPVETRTAQAAVESLEDQLETAKLQMGELRKHKDQIDQAYADISHLVDKLQVQLDETRQKPGDKSTTDTIQEYLASQQREREARGAAWKKFQDSGVKLSDILPQRSIVDQALANRRAPKK